MRASPPWEGRSASLLVMALLAAACASPVRPRLPLPAASEEVWIVARDAAITRRADSTPGAPALLARQSGVSGDAEPLARVRTDVAATLVGPIASIERHTRYAGPVQAADGFVAFTPPAAPARQDLVLRLGARRVRVLVRERDEAGQAHASASLDGKAATLLSTDAGGRVVASVGALAPGEPVDLGVTTVGLVPWRDGAYELTLPRVPAADVQATIDVHGGGPIVVVNSPSHTIDTQAAALDRVRVTLREPATLRDADFVLRYRIDPETNAGALLVQPDGSGAIVGLVLHPQEENHEPVALAGVSIDWGTTRVTDVRPPAVGKVAAGAPLVVLARVEGVVAGPALLTARAGSRPRRLTIPIAADVPVDGLRALPVLWARAGRAEVVARR